MSTHSRIGLTHGDGTITSIYCHWDGDLCHNGRILTEHYGDTERITALLALGNLSELGEELGECHDFRTHGKAHPEWCLAYERDRGDAEELCAVSADERAYLTLAREGDAQYVYLYQFGDWYAYSGRTGSWYLVRTAHAAWLNEAVRNAA